MTHQIRLDSSFVSDASRDEITANADTDADCSLLVHSEAGKGAFTQYLFNNSVFSIAKNVNYEDFVIEEDIASPVVMLHFDLYGTIVHHLYSKRKVGTGFSSSDIFLFRHSRRFGMVRNKPSVSLSIQVPPDRFRELLEGDMAPIRQGFPDRFDRPAGADLLVNGSMPTPRMQVILHEILDAPLHGAIRRIYIEGKVYELMALRLDQWREIESRGQKATVSFVLRKDDIEKIRSARDILIGCLDEPPTISVLARRVGINEFKLKNGFKRVFGQTIFGYLREHRLEKARTLLEKREMNVAEIAYEVGYNNPAHFACAFRKRYGMNPGRLLSQNGKSYSI